MDGTFRRRDFAAAGLLALSPLLTTPAQAKLRIKSGSTSTSTSTSTTTTTTTTTSTSTSTSTSSTTITGDTCTYGAPVLDSTGRANFAGRSWGVQRDTSKSYALEQSTDVTPLRHRFEVRSGDTWSGDSGTARNRSEYCSGTKETNGREVWFSYALRLHSGVPVTSAWNILGQFHNTPDPGDCSASPPFAFCFIPGEKLRILKRTDPNPTTTTNPASTVLFETGLVRDRWYRFVGRIVFGWMNDGACEIWMDGTKVVSLPVTNIGYNDLQGPYWKFGIYRAAASETLVAEYANFEIGPTSLLSRVTSPLPLV